MATNISKVLSDVFFGTQQSKYAAVAIFITIAILCFFILFTSSDIPFEQRFLVVFFILLATIPSILFSLFELTCIVTGGTKTTRWWCYYLAWFISIFMIVYCIFIIISVFLSMASYDTAVSRINDSEEDDRVTNTEANEYAKNIMLQYQQEADEMKAENKQVNKDPVIQQPKINHNEPRIVEETVHPITSSRVDDNSIKSMSAQLHERSNIPSYPSKLTLPVSGFERDNFAPISNTPDMSMQYPALQPNYTNPLYPKTSNNVPEPFTNMNNNLQDFHEFK